MYGRLYVKQKSETNFSALSTDNVIPLEKNATAVYITLVFLCLCTKKDELVEMETQNLMFYSVLAGCTEICISGPKLTVRCIQLL